jgi:predicted RNA-binding protein with PUA-like domain
MKYWLLKTEPETFSINDLEKDKKTIWSGVRNYQVRNLIRDEMKNGDMCFIYHSSCKDVGIVGLGKVVSLPYLDPVQFDINSEYFDVKSTTEKIEKNPKNLWYVVDIEFVSKFTKIFSLKEMRENKNLQNMKVLQKGSRLSINEVAEKDFKYVIKYMNDIGSK